MRGMIDKLVFPGQEPGTAYVGELNQNRVVHKMDHLACFVGGMLALGSEWLETSRRVPRRGGKRH